MERAIGAQEFFLLSMGNIILDFNGFNEWINLKFLQLAYKPGQASLKWPIWTRFEVVRGRTQRIPEIWTTRKITLCPDMLYFDFPQEEKFEFQATRCVGFLLHYLCCLSNFQKKLSNLLEKGFLRKKINKLGLKGQQGWLLGPKRLASHVNLVGHWPK